MSKKFKRYLVTSALPYVNGPLHIGHIAGAYLPADTYVRYLRLKGEDVVYICGSDEHGAAITLRAKKEGIAPNEIIDKYHELNKKTFEEFGISFDFYHRTSSPLHHKTAADFFTVLYEKGEFIKQSSEQYYDEEHQQFLADRYITGTCPRCGYNSADGDQCEKCGSALNPKDLIKPKSMLSGNPPVLKETTHWYLPMDKYEPWLKKWILEEHKNDWKANVYGQCKSWLDSGLQPRAVTRDLNWGVKVPLKEAAEKVLYVWFDAPIGYISSTKAWAEKNGKNWELYWKNSETKLVHFIGKDNIVFHCIIFPAMLKAHGEFILPENIPANEFLNLEKQKLSTSRNHAVWLHEYLHELPGKQDELRYVLTRFSPETSDNEFTWKDYQANVNNELVAVFGNFINRILVLTHKYYGGKVPQISEVYADKAKKTLNFIHDLGQRVADLIEHFRFRDAQQEAMSLAREGNRFLTENEPWKLVKTDEEKTKYILYIVLQYSANLAVLIKPFLPFTASRLLKILNLSENNLNWNDIGRSEHLLKQGHSLENPELLFARIEDEQVQEQIEKLHSKKLHPN